MATAQPLELWGQSLRGEAMLSGARQPRWAGGRAGLEFNKPTCPLSLSLHALYCLLPPFSSHPTFSSSLMAFFHPPTSLRHPNYPSQPTRLHRFLLHLSPPPRITSISSPHLVNLGARRISCSQFALYMPQSDKMGGRGELKVFESIDELGASLADYVAKLSEAAVKERGSFAVALSGGSLISTMGKLCDPPYLKTIDWSRWHVFWADERVVARNHPDSNYKLAKDGLLSKVPILPGQVYSINDALSAEAAADDYEFGLRQLVKTKIVGVAANSDCPQFDLILLGMGPDGHVASLFPNHPLTHEKERWITFITDSPKPPPERITFTFPVINSAANIVMVVNGAGKAEVLEKVFGEVLPPGLLPAQMVSPAEGKLVWFLDKDAASKLPGVNQPT